MRREKMDKNDIGGQAAERRIKHYSSNHKILLVGEGDFSFSKCLATAFGTAANMTATSLDNEEWLMRKHIHAMVNVKELRNLGCTIMHGVSARGMKDHSQLQSMYFDRIVFNFPHSGFSHRAENTYHMIKRHRKLVRAFLMNASEMLTEKGQVHVTHKTTYPYSEWDIVELAEDAGLRLLKKSAFLMNASEMLTEKGQVHVTHKTTYPYSEWDIVELAEDAGLRLLKKSAFDIGDYDGYVNKKGDGSKCDKSFPVGNCCTFKFAM